MHIMMPPSDKEMNVAAIKRAIDRKKIEVEQAQNKLIELKAELRGLDIALRTIDPKIESADL